MNKKQQEPRFRDIWVNQTELGRHFGLNAVAVGKKLSEFGLRNEQKEPSELAHREGYCCYAPMKDGTSFYLWHKEKVGTLFCQAGLKRLSKEEVEARCTAIELIVLGKQADVTGLGKALSLFIDDIPHSSYPLVNRYLSELGSDLRLAFDTPVLSSQSVPQRKYTLSEESARSDSRKKRS